MKLWFRLLLYALSLTWRSALQLPKECSSLTFRVWPTDLDTSLLMNNGRYLTIMDMGRLDIMVRGGLWRAVLRHRWTPIASAVSLRFRRELRAFPRVRIETRLVCWHEASVVMEQRFLFAGGARDGELAASALFLGGLYDRKARTFVPVRRLMEEVGVTAESPEPGPDVVAFLAAHDALRLADRERASAG